MAELFLLTAAVITAIYFTRQAVVRTLEANANE